MSKNIEININNGSGYELLLPKASYSNMNDSLAIDNTIGNLPYTRISNLPNTFTYETGSYVGTNTAKDVVIQTTNKILILFLFRSIGNNPTQVKYPLIFWANSTSRMTIGVIYSWKQGVIAGSITYKVSNNVLTIVTSGIDGSATYNPNSVSFNNSFITDLYIHTANADVTYRWMAITIK